MSSTEPMSRRRFLAVIAGTTGAAAAAGFGGWKLLTGHGGSTTPTVAAQFLDAYGLDGSARVIEVQPGFADAAVWNDELLTLRADPRGNGIILRSEIDGRDYSVDAPEGFVARCVGVIDGRVVVGGHRVVRTAQMTFEAGPGYDALAARGGALAGVLGGEPMRPAVEGYIHVFADRHASLAVSEGLTSWDVSDGLLGGRGGSLGAVLGVSGLLVADRYADAEVPDSVFEAAFATLAGVRSGDAAPAGIPLGVDHGALWGAAAAFGGDVVVVADRWGTRGYGSASEMVFELSDGSELLGVDAAGDTVVTAVRAPGGGRELRRYRDGAAAAVTVLPVHAPVLHRVAPEVSVAHSVDPAADLDRDNREART